PTLVRLSVLSLAFNQIHDEGALALAASPHLAHLRQLNLEGNRIGHHGLPALRAAAQAHPRLWINVGPRTPLSPGVPRRCSCRAYFGNFGYRALLKRAGGPMMSLFLGSQTFMPVATYPSLPRLHLSCPRSQPVG